MIWLLYQKDTFFFYIFLGYSVLIFFFVLRHQTGIHTWFLKTRPILFYFTIFYSLAFYFRKTLKWEICYMALGFSLTGLTKWSTCFQSAMIYFWKNLQTCKTPLFVFIKLLSWTWLRYEVGQRHLEPNFELQMLFNH